MAKRIILIHQAGNIHKQRNIGVYNTPPRATHPVPICACIFNHANDSVEGWRIDQTDFACNN